MYLSDPEENHKFLRIFISNHPKFVNVALRKILTSFLKTFEVIITLIACNILLLHCVKIIC